MERNDGLMRGARGKRIKEMRSLRNEKWDMGTLLFLHVGLLDHACDVRSVALESLMEIAARSPESFMASPLTLLSYFRFGWSLSSGNTPRVFRFFVELGTPEAEEAVLAILEGPAQHCRNEDFELFLSALEENGKTEIIRGLENRKFSTAKKKILKKILDTI